MKNFKLILALLIVFSFLAASCGSDDDGVETATGPDSTLGQSSDADDDVDPDSADADEETDTEEADTDEDGDGEMSERIERFWVGPQLVDCIGEAPQKCMLIKRTADGTAEYFYDSIAGFTHEVGTSYVLDVAVTDVENPPADASSLSYRLVEIIESSSATVSDQIDATSWVLLGFRDGDLFDPVADGVEITINFAGEQVNGSAGCNNYMGSFSADGDALTFGPLASTKMMCPPEIMTFEDRFLPLISQVETAQWTFDERLVLSGPTGMDLVFAPAT